jgi:glycosyltransferase involved in cell wall biosynthesis
MGNSSAKNLALVTETWPPEINGVAMTLSRLADGLAARDWRVRLVRPRQAADSGDAGNHKEHLLVPGLPIPGYAGLRFGLPMYDMLRRHWSESRPDVVHIATEGPLGWAAMSVAQRLAIPVTSSFHTNFHRYCRHYRLGWLRGAVTRHLRRFHNRSALTMAPCETLCSTLRLEGYRNVVALGRGVDTGLFDPARRSQTLRSAWGAGPEDMVAMHVGRLAPEKNLRTVAAACAAMERLHPLLRMVWVGDGPQLNKLRRQYPQHIFTGAKVGEELATHYASADIFLFPSLTETYGNVLPEAMASGLAVVAFDYAAAALYVRHGQNGLLAPYGDTEAFIRQAERLVQAQGRLRRLGLRGRDTVNLHSWEAVCGQFDRYLKAVAKGGGS